MLVKLFTFISAGETGSKDPNDITARGEKVCIWIPGNCIILWINSDNPCYYKTETIVKEELFSELKTDNGDVLVVKEPGFNVSESRIIPLIDAASKYNRKKVIDLWSKTIRDCHL